MTYPSANGCAIAWWRRLLKGATIKDLHRSWTFSTSIKDAALAGKYVNVIALAALTAKLTIIDGMLMQEATSARIREDLPIEMSANIFPFGNVRSSIPETGSRKLDSGGSATWLSTELGNALEIWANSGPLLSHGFGGCDGYCFLNVPAAGFEFDCTEESAKPINFGSRLMATGNSSSGLPGPANNTRDVSEETVFELTFTAVKNNTNADSRNASAAYSYIQADFIYSQAQDTSDYCPGVRYHRSCRLRPALISYPIMVQTSRANGTTNGTRVGITESTYQQNGMDGLHPGSYNSTLKQIEGYKVLNYTDIYEDETATGSTQLGGIVAGLDMYLTGSATLELDDTATGFTLRQLDHAARYLNNSVRPDGCGYNYVDPLKGFAKFGIPGVLESINEIMFTLVADFSLDSPVTVNGNQMNSTIGSAYDSTQYSFSIHYHTNFTFMAGALVSTFICVLFVLPTYWGFWQLGRKLALSPLEIAAAFRSPLVDSGKDIDGILQEAGKTQVRFGHIVSGEAAGRLGVAEHGQVERVLPGRRLDPGDSRPATRVMQ
jgi:hypothetical protein